jgi:hypothetical protein
MAPSASKQKRLAEKVSRFPLCRDDVLTVLVQAAKASTKGSSSAMASTDVSAAGTPMTNLSANGSTEDLADSAAAQMAKLSTATDRSANGVLVSDPKSRDIKIDQYSLSFHGRLLIEGAEISLNYGNRYGLLGENGSGKSTFLQSIAERDVEIPEHIDVSPRPFFYWLDTSLTLAAGLPRPRRRRADRSQRPRLHHHLGPGKSRASRKARRGNVHGGRRGRLGPRGRVRGARGDGPGHVRGQGGRHPQRFGFHQDDDGQADKGYVRWVEDACCPRAGVVRQAALVVVG